MSYAIVLISGKQVRLHNGDIIEVDKVDIKKGETIILDKILLYNDGEKTVVGQPYVKGIQVEGEIIDQFKGKKLYISKFKSKVRYRRKTGFRAQLTRIKIIKIGVFSEKKSSEKVIKKTVEPKIKTVAKKVTKRSSK